MHTHSLDARQGPADSYLFGPRPAWFAFAMTLALYLFDYIDRQVIVSLFPHMKQDWGLSDKQLGGLVSVVSVTVALGALPVALVADRTSRVKSIVVMATVWSLASISCMFTRSYGQLLAARAQIGMGEAGYGAAGVALIAGHFPARMRGVLMAGFFAAASVGSVLGVMLGGLIAAHWGWKAAFGVVGFPGLLLALLYLKVRDYPTVALTPSQNLARGSMGSAAKTIAKALVRSRTMLWVCVGGAAQMLVLSALWSWLPSFLNREYGMAPDQAGIKAALVVLCGAVGSVVWGAVVDRAGARRPRARLHVMTLLCIASLLVVAVAFGAPRLGLEISAQVRFALIALGGFLLTCTVGPVTAIVIDVTPPALRATNASVLAIFLALFGLAAGSFIAGVLSDAWGLTTALTVMPAIGLLAPLAFMFAARTYEADMQRAGQPLDEPTPTPMAGAANAPA
ncbi:MFS transporter [Variovorax sp. dw_954]|uniref:MFS transporter n=1 Tax=Variovorax sp. dw_954 TaxID=2720078 RepID=UPI001BD509B2|nr:MFS transporter [Variovorax sp. dw_954]